MEKKKVIVNKKSTKHSKIMRIEPYLGMTIDYAEDDEDEE